MVLEDARLFKCTYMHAVLEQKSEFRSTLIVFSSPGYTVGARSPKRAKLSSSQKSGNANPVTSHSEHKVSIHPYKNLQEVLTNF